MKLKFFTEPVLYQPWLTSSGSTTPEFFWLTGLEIYRLPSQRKLWRAGPGSGAARRQAYRSLCNSRGCFIQCDSFGPRCCGIHNQTRHRHQISIFPSSNSTRAAGIGRLSASLWLYVLSVHQHINLQPDEDRHRCLRLGRGRAAVVYYIIYKAEAGGRESFNN